MATIHRAVSLLLLAACGLTFLAGCSGPSPGTPAPASSTASGAREFRVEGMVCEGCVEMVTESIKKVPGVQSVQVLLDQKKALVVADPAQVPSEKIVAAVTAAGYKAEPLAAAKPASER